MTDLKETPLRTDFITDWVAALRSDLYKQGMGALRSREATGPTTREVVHCCLGVACEVGIRYGVIERRDNEYLAIGEAADRVMPDGWNAMTLPAGFWQWIGLDGSDPRPGDEGPSLTSFNDEQDMDFHDIADIIERTWLKATVDA